MKIQNVFLFIVVLIVLLPNNFNTNKLSAIEDFSEYIGYASALTNNIKFDDEKIIPKENCKCNGTKKVKSGDGIVDMPCQCGDNCDCKSSDENLKCQCGCGKVNCSCKLSKSKCVVSSELEPTNYCYRFTAKWCIPCKTFDKTETPILEKFNWKYGDVPKDGIHIVNIDIDKNPELYQKIIDSLPQRLKNKVERKIPAFVFMKNSKPFDIKEGFMSAGDFCKFFNDNVEAK